VVRTFGMTLFGVHYRMDGESAEKDSVWCIKRSRKFLLTLSLSEIANNDLADIYLL